MNNTYNKNYVVKRINKNLSYDEIYKEQYNEVKNYHYRYGQYGFGSERTYSDMFEIKARNNTEKIIERSKILNVMKYVIVEFGKEEEKMKEIEEIEGENFLRWL
jgi:hypothetical protein